MLPLTFFLLCYSPVFSQVKIYYKVLANGTKEHPLWVDVDPDHPELHAGMIVLQVKKMVLENYQRDGWFFSKVATGFDFNSTVVTLLGGATTRPVPAGYENRIVELKVPALPGYYADDKEFLDTVAEVNTKTEVKKFLNQIKKDPSRQYIYYWLVFPPGVSLTAADSKVMTDLHFLKCRMEDDEGNEEEMEAVNIRFQIAESGGIEVEELVEKKSFADLRAKRTNN